MEFENNLLFPLFNFDEQFHLDNEDNGSSSVSLLSPVENSTNDEKNESERLLYLVRCRTYYITCVALTFGIEEQIQLHSHVRLDLGYYHNTHCGYEVGKIAWMGFKKEIYHFNRHYNFVSFNQDFYPLIVDLATDDDLSQISKHLNDELMYETHCQEVLQRHGCPNVKLQITIQYDESRVYVFIQKKDFYIPLKVLFHGVFPSYYNVLVNVVKRLHNTYDFDITHRSIPVYVVAFRSHYVRCTSSIRVFDYVKVRIDENTFDIGTVVHEGNQWNIPWHLYPHASLNENIKEIIQDPHCDEDVPLQIIQKIEKKCEKKCRKLFPGVNLQINLQADHKRCYIFIEKSLHEHVDVMVHPLNNLIKQFVYSYLRNYNMKKYATIDVTCDLVTTLK